MNFFKSKDPDIAEVSREKRIKESIVNELSTVLKSIQATQQNRLGEPVYTSDASTQLCNVFEAVFLHGNKTCQKLQGGEFDTQSLERCSYWTFVQRFTHKDIIHQLKKLNLIHTEVGLCRAWVKLAINDGLMESYITAMLAQPKTVQSYYSRTALLRDIEQPDIMLKLIQVLGNFDFQLVYNSSQLNSWSVKTLALIGLVDRPFLLQSANKSSPSMHSDRSRTSALDMDDLPESLPPLHVDSTPWNISRELSQDSSDVFEDGEVVQKVPNNTPLQRNLSANVYDKLQTLGEEDNTDTAAAAPTPPASTSSNSSSQVFDNNLLIDTAARELDRLRKAHFSIEDILGSEEQVTETASKTDEHVDHSSEKDLKEDDQPGNPFEEDDTQSDPNSHQNETESANQPKRSPDTGQQTGSYKSSPHRGYLSGHSSFADDVRDFDSSSPAQSAYTVVSADSNSEYLSTNQTSSEENLNQITDNHYQGKITSKEIAEDNPFLDDSGSLSTAAAGGARSKLFHVGTPQSDYMFGRNNQEYDDDDNNMSDQEEDFQDAYTEDPQSGGAGKPISSISQSSSPEPLSAARYIMKKRLSAGGGEIRRDYTTSGGSLQLSSSLGSRPLIHGNSIASLTGWRSVEDVDESGVYDGEEARGRAMPQVQSFADMVSESKRSAAESLGSPTGNYSSYIQEQTTYIEQSGEEEKVKPHFCKDDKSTTVGGTKAITTVSGVGASSGATEDFVVVGELDQENCADILAHYGEICQDGGLDAQDFKCHNCSAPVGIIYGPVLVCSYTKKYYCPNCHVNEESFVPAKIVFNWDFGRYKVSKSSRDFLTSAESMPLINIQYLNPSLYSHVPELEKCKYLRTQLFYLKRYLFACSATAADELKQKFWPKEYLYEEIHTYSVQDLLLVNTSSSLYNQLKRGVKYAREHVQGCQSCEYRGFICEICNNSQVIFPFNLDTTKRCDRCNAVYHSACFTDVCPKCERIDQRNKLLGKSSEDNVDSKRTGYLEL